MSEGTKSFGVDRVPSPVGTITLVWDEDQARGPGRQIDLLLSALSKKIDPGRE